MDVTTVLGEVERDVLFAEEGERSFAGTEVGGVGDGADGTGEVRLHLLDLVSSYCRYMCM